MRRKKTGLIALSVGIVSALHFATPAGAHGWHWAHILFQKLYYIPLLMAAYCLGVRGTIVTSGSVPTIGSGGLVYRLGIDTN